MFWKDMRIYLIRTISMIYCSFHLTDFVLFVFFCRRCGNYLWSITLMNVIRQLVLRMISSLPNLLSIKNSTCWKYSEPWLYRIVTMLQLYGFPLPPRTSNWWRRSKRANSCTTCIHTISTWRSSTTTLKRRSRRFETRSMPWVLRLNGYPLIGCTNQHYSVVFAFLNYT